MISPRNWEWPGGKIEGGVAGEGMRRTFGELDYLTGLKEALREVSEELVVTRGLLPFIEPLPWKDNYARDVIRDRDANLSLRIAAFRAQVWSDVLPVIPPSEEHFGGVWFRMLDWSGNPREQYQSVVGQVNEKVLFGKRTQERGDVFDFVITYEERTYLDVQYNSNGQVPPGFIVLPINDSSALTGKQYFALQFFREQF